MTDMCILVTAAVCHDLDHPGYNNTYVKLCREQCHWQHCVFCQL